MLNISFETECLVRFQEQVFLYCQKLRRATVEALPEIKGVEVNCNSFKHRSHISSFFFLKMLAQVEFV